MKLMLIFLTKQIFWTQRQLVYLQCGLCNYWLLFEILQGWFLILVVLRNLLCKMLPSQIEKRSRGCERLPMLWSKVVVKWRIGCWISRKTTTTERINRIPIDPTLVRRPSMMALREKRSAKWSKTVYTRREKETMVINNRFVCSHCHNFLNNNDKLFCKAYE